MQDEGVPVTIVTVVYPACHGRNVFCIGQTLGGRLPLHISFYVEHIVHLQLVIYVATVLFFTCFKLFTFFLTFHLVHKPPAPTQILYNHGVTRYNYSCNEGVIMLIIIYVHVYFEWVNDTWLKCTKLDPLRMNVLCWIIDLWFACYRKAGCRRH